nr:MAG TPA: YqbG [Caudoviricetes sp.]
MAYADYQYYKNTYLGTAIQEADFPRLALRASSSDGLRRLSVLQKYIPGDGHPGGRLSAPRPACKQLFGLLHAGPGGKERRVRRAENVLLRPCGTVPGHRDRPGTGAKGPDRFVGIQRFRGTAKPDSGQLV